jgi:hypothetical protein
MRGIGNPIGLKCGPTMEPNDLLPLIDKLNPDNIPGRLTLIGRFGSDKVHDRLPRLMLFVGPQGVGKQRLALWLSQRMVCTQPGPVEPCGSCQPCRQVLDLAYPDLHWMVPVPRPKAGESDKQQEEVAEAIGKVMEERRKAPLWGPAEGLDAHFMATSQLILRRASLTPAAGRRKVFLIGEAERLIPQESSPEAANALLKLFDELAAQGLTFIVITHDDRYFDCADKIVKLDYGNVVDSVLLWWRNDDGDLVDRLMDAITPLAEDGVVWVVTPKTGHPGHVKPSDIAESAPTAGLMQTSSANLGDWIASRLVQPKSGPTGRR